MNLSKEEDKDGQPVTQRSMKKPYLGLKWMAPGAAKDTVQLVVAHICKARDRLMHNPREHFKLLGSVESAALGMSNLDHMCFCIRCRSISSRRSV